ncbi:hypothetical protein [Mycobacterium simiae]|uniref:Uncharacterized protein n=1 Tax=Mycobacterium simiae TaxID=1784 RepID=A0A1X0Y3F3_MYCSI|nr:hypothetical protein [Mycobacterium simiae]ORJ59673.1 hypothetical protein B5M45_15385 [Mycobacterium simiae]
MTIESDLRFPRFTPTTSRGRRYLAYVREQSAPAAGDKVPGRSGPPCRSCSSAPANHADVVQAALFADMLRAEHAELGAVARAQGPDAGSFADQLLVVQARMKEIRRLLEALERRFGEFMADKTDTPPTPLERHDHRR